MTAAQRLAMLEIIWARPPKTTRTTGLPVFSSSSTYCSCLPGRRRPSRSLFSPHSITFSPTAAIITSACWAMPSASALSIFSPASTLRCSSANSQARSSPPSVYLVSIVSVQSQPREYMRFIPSGIRDFIPSNSPTTCGWSRSVSVIFQK